MARYRATLDTSVGREDAFAYLSDFSTTREWDPGVIEAERLTDAPIGDGSEFRLIAEFLGRRSELTYRIVEYNPPHAVGFRGENATVVSNDRITFDVLGDGRTRIGYTAELTLRGALRLADPLLGLAFNRVGDRALSGLRHRLTPAPDDTLRPLRGRGLDGRPLELPDDLAKPYNLLLVAFRREQQQLVDQWLPWATELEAERDDLSVYELPVISSRYRPTRRYVDGGMVRGIPDPVARARTITVYTDVRSVVANLGLVGTETIAVLVVGNDGRIIARERGCFEAQKAERLATALMPGTAEQAAA